MFGLKSFSQPFTRTWALKPLEGEINEEGPTFAIGDLDTNPLGAEDHPRISGLRFPFSGIHQRLVDMHLNLHDNRHSVHSNLGEQYHTISLLAESKFLVSSDRSAQFALSGPKDANETGTLRDTVAQRF
jgi:hypothetical protein